MFEVLRKFKTKWEAWDHENGGPADKREKEVKEKELSTSYSKRLD